MRILQLSDIHYGAHGWLAPGDRAPDGSPVRTLVDALLVLFRNQKPDALVISGDLSQRADERELLTAAAEIKRLAENLSLSLQRVIVTPGNHDVSWDLAKAGRDAAFGPWRRFLQQLYGDRLVRDLYGELESADLVAVHEFQGVAIASVNSCFFESDRDHFGYVGGTQIEHLRKALERVTTERRIVVMHHHLLPTLRETIPERPLDPPVTAMDLSVVRDSGVVLQRLGELGVSVVLHGHKHESVRRFHAFADGQRTRGVYLLGNGTAGVDSREVPQLAGYHARIIEPQENGVVRVTELHSSQYTWRSSPPETLTQGYDELSNLTSNLRGQTVDQYREVSVLSLLEHVANKNADWSGRDPAELMRYVGEIAKTSTHADNVFWWCIVHGVFQYRNTSVFQNDNSDDWEDSVELVQLSVRGALLLNQLAT